MADIYGMLDQRDLTAVSTPVSLYTAGGTETTIIKHIRVVNQSSSNSTAIRMWQTGVTDDDLILPTADIAGGGWAEFEGTIILNPGDTISASKENSTDATTADLTITLYGLEMTP
jgi:hypothetical protein